MASNFAALDNNASAIAVLEFFQMLLFTFFGAHRQGAQFALKKGNKLRKLIPGCEYDHSAILSIQKVKLTSSSVFWILPSQLLFQLL